MKEMGRSQQLRTGEVLIIVVVLFMWAGESASPSSNSLDFWEMKAPGQTPSLTGAKGGGLEAAER